VSKRALWSAVAILVLVGPPAAFLGRQGGEAGREAGELLEFAIVLDGPHGSFTPDAPERVDGLVLIAGGVGITPMMSMLRTLAERGDRRLHRVVLAERPDQPLFGPELEVLGRRLDLDVLRTAGRRVDADLLAEILPRARGRLEYYVCGPPGLLTGSLAALDQLGVPPGRIHSEQFGWTGPLRPRSRRLGRCGRRTTPPRPPTGSRPTPRSRSRGWRSGRARRRRGAAESKGEQRGPT
jgi:NAD(P)H-flavin reductase